METAIHNLDELDEFAKRTHDDIIAAATPHEGGALVIGLSGDLGAGKTAFTKSLARAFGVTETVSSPTFVIARFYPLAPNNKYAQLIHIDAYRIESTDELKPIGWEKLLQDEKNLILVEWPEKMKEKFPSDARIFQFTVVDETTRVIRA